MVRYDPYTDSFIPINFDEYTIQIEVSDKSIEKIADAVMRKLIDHKTEPQKDLVKESPSLVKDLVKAFGEDGTWLERQGVYTLTLAEAKQRAVDIIESVFAKTEPQTERDRYEENEDY